jgi:hypothetical protein
VLPFKVLILLVDVAQDLNTLRPVMPFAVVQPAYFRLYFRLNKTWNFASGTTEAKINLQVCAAFRAGRRLPAAEEAKRSSDGGL